MEARHPASTRWHQVTSLDERTFLITEPLGVLEPSFGVATANMFLVCGRERAALIDTGVGIGPLSLLVESLTSLPYLVLNTHYHWDHTGNNALFADCAIHESEAGELDVEEDMRWLKPKLDTEAARAVLPLHFDPSSYTIPPRPAARRLRGGETIELGGRSLIALHTPGHSPGHMVYFDQGGGFLFTGDLAYRGPVYACFRESDPALFLASLRTCEELDGVRMLCPGHNEPVMESGFLARVSDALEAGLAGEVEGVHRRTPFRGTEHRFGEISIWLPDHRRD